MLSRLIGKKYDQTGYGIVSPEIKAHLRKSDYTIANLESPILDKELNNSDHLVFNARSNILKEFGYIDFFSLGNNHINDCGVEGIENTIKSLSDNNFECNGIYQGDYAPFTTTVKDVKFAIFTCTDMMNIELTGEYKVPFVDDDFLLQQISDYKQNGYIIIMYAHMGQLFSRFPNPIIRKYAHSYCDAGVDIVLTVHPHVLGGIEDYKDKKIVYSLGDFVMDGNSFRRRRACILDIEISEINKKIENIEFIPTNINKELITIFSKGFTKGKALNGWNKVSNVLSKYDLNKYEKKYKSLYKKEIFNHNFSTIYFLIRTKGLLGFFKMFLKRIDEVKMMIRWIIKDRSNLTKDDDAILKDRKKFSSDELF